jgi:serine/threonine-protein kinase RsbW
MPTEPLQRHSLTLDGAPDSSGKGSAWARDLAERAKVSEARIDAIDLCIVELVSNIVNHSYRGRPGEIRLELALGQGAAILTVVDDGPAFDPLSVSAPVVPESLDEATLGGFGIHLVRSSADACEYERREGKNVFTACFGTSQR